MKKYKIIDSIPTLYTDNDHRDFMEIVKKRLKSTEEYDPEEGGPIRSSSEIVWNSSGYGYIKKVYSDHYRGYVSFIIRSEETYDEMLFKRTEDPKVFQSVDKRFTISL